MWITACSEPDSASFRAQPNRPLPRARFPATQNSARPSVKPDGSIADVKFDTVEAGLAFDSSGTLTGDASQEIHTKKELGDDYGLKAASGIGKEWYEQIDALEEWMRGKMVSDVLGMKVTEREGDGKQLTDEEDLKTSVTISVTDQLRALEKAYADAQK